MKSAEKIHFPTPKPPSEVDPWWAGSPGHPVPSFSGKAGDARVDGGSADTLVGLHQPSGRAPGQRWVPPRLHRRADTRASYWPVMAPRPVIASFQRDLNLYCSLLITGEALVLFLLRMGLGVVLSAFASTNSRSPRPGIRTPNQYHRFISVVRISTVRSHRYSDYSFQDPRVGRAHR